MPDVAKNYDYDVNAFRPTMSHINPHCARGTTADCHMHTLAGKANFERI